MTAKYNPKKKPGWKEIPFGGAAWVKSTEYKTGEWKTFRPVHDNEKCINCGQCWAYCPDNAITWKPELRTKEKPKARTITVDFDMCKGCGICAHECPKQAYTMEKD